VSDPPQPAAPPDHPPIDAGRWERLARSALEAEGAPPGVEVGLRFVDEDEMTALNREHLGGDGPTDVLSFPLDFAEGIPEIVPASSDRAADADAGVPAIAGDIVICAAVAARNAPDHAGTFDDELALLVVHSVLHLVGHDHGEADERAAMHARERELLAALYGPLAGDPWHDTAEAPVGDAR
jgi:probable rRNA maturation factor